MFRTSSYARKCRAIVWSVRIPEFHQTFSSSSIVIPYLEKSCGFTPERALSASNYMYFETPERADSVLAFLKNHHFTESQISTLIRRRPPILLSIPDKTLLPKIQFLESIGICKSHIPHLLCKTPNLLARSLQRMIIPTFDLLKTLLKSEDDVLFAINRFPEILATPLDARVSPNLDILREAGVLESGILYCLKHMPRLLVNKKPERLKECVERAKEIGFRPDKNIFLQGVKVLALTVDSTWQRKTEVYKKCGWSEEEVIESFRRHPHCMVASESKITTVVDILVNKMGYHVSNLVRLPIVILLSLEKTIVPRCAVYQVLLLKGLVKENLGFTQWLLSPKKKFLDRFVLCHDKEAPDLLKLFEKKGRAIEVINRQE